MEKVVQIGNWIFEVKQIKAIRATEYGEPYNGIMTINNIDGVAHIDGLLVQEGEASRQDLIDIQVFLSRLGFKEYSYSRYNKNLEQQIKTKGVTDECS